MLSRAQGGKKLTSKQSDPCSCYFGVDNIESWCMNVSQKWWRTIPDHSGVICWRIWERSSFENICIWAGLESRSLISLFVQWFVCLSICLSFFLSFCLSIYLSVCMSVQLVASRVVYFLVWLDLGSRFTPAVSRIVGRYVYLVNLPHIIVLSEGGECQVLSIQRPDY